MSMRCINPLEERKVVGIAGKLLMECEGDISVQGGHVHVADRPVKLAAREGIYANGGLYRKMCSSLVGSCLVFGR